MDAQLKVVDGAKDAVIRLKLPTIVGRGAESSLKVPQSEVSRSHCEIYEEDGLLAVFDLGSSNGTFVNGERIEDPTFLYPGDLLRIGNVTVEAVYVPAEGADIPGSVTQKSKAAGAAESPQQDDVSAKKDVAPAKDDAPKKAIKKSPPKDPVKRTADSSASLSGVSAIVDYSENQGGSFIAIQAIEAIDMGGEPVADVSSVNLDTGDSEAPAAASGFSLDADGATDDPAVESGDSKLDDFFRNLE